MRSPATSYCRAPRTASRRGALAYCKLLERVHPDASDGFGYVGKFLPPGSPIDAADLRLGKGRNAVILESTEVEGERDPAGRIRWERLYCLWRWDTGESKWIEIARCRDNSGDWAYFLREPARIALGRESWTVITSIPETAERIRKVLERELESIEPSQRGKVLAELHDQLGAGIARSGVA